MATIDDVLAKLKRRIGSSIDKSYTDEVLTNFIIDAVDVLIATYPVLGFDIEATQTGFSRDATQEESAVIALQAYILYEKGLKHVADSENFKMTKGRLTLDNTNQTDDLAQSVDNLEAELQKMFNRISQRYKRNLYQNIGGVRVQSGGVDE